MQVNLNQKINSFLLTLVLVTSIFCVYFIGIPKAYAASTTPWQITNLSNAVITTTRSTVNQGWYYLIQNQSGITTFGTTYDNQDNYSDGLTTGSPNSVRLHIQKVNESINILAGDAITLTSTDGNPTSIRVFMPAITTDTTLYIANDGSTYTDSGLTTLAYIAPITMNITTSSNTAYNFGKIIPNLTYTTANDIQNITITTNESTGWILYIKATTSNFVSGANSIPISCLEWRYDNSSQDWTDLSTTDTNVRSDTNPTSLSGVITGIEYRLNIPYGSIPAADYTATITYTAVTQ